MAGTSDGKGYTLVASDGGVLNFGDSTCYGSVGGNPPSTPVVDLSPCPANNGSYLLVNAGPCPQRPLRAPHRKTSGHRVERPGVG